MSCSPPLYIWNEKAARCKGLALSLLKDARRKKPQVNSERKKYGKTGGKTEKKKNGKILCKIKTGLGSVGKLPVQEITKNGKNR